MIDGKFPDYKKVVPTNNESFNRINQRLCHPIERVASVSIDRKEGVNKYK